MNARSLGALAGIALLAGGWLPVQAAAELYKWVDEEGNVTYSQVPPVGRDATAIAAPRPLPAPPPAPAAGPSGSPAAEETGPTPEQRLAAEKNCEIARRNLEIFKTYSRVRNDRGEVTVMDDATRAARVAQTERDIKEFCK